MACKQFGKLIKALMREDSGAGIPNPDTLVPSRFHLLSVGLRIDTTIPAGSGKGLGVSHFIWVSTVERPRPEDSLRILHYPN